MSILLYHGSPTGKIQTLMPFTADHGKPYVYFTTSDVSAALYAPRAVERPHYWVPCSYDAQGRLVYTEVWEHAFADVFAGRSGYLYCCEGDDKALLRFPTHQSLRLSARPVGVLRSERIDDLHAWLLKRAAEGRLVIQRYESLAPEQLSLWHGMALESLAGSFSGTETDNAFARFVREKMPAVWERFLLDAR